MTKVGVVSAERGFPPFHAFFFHRSLSPVPYHLRQLSGVLLKQFVSKHWGTLPGDPDSSLVVIAEGEKNAIKKTIPSALSASQSKIRTAAGMVSCRAVFFSEN
jgi:hypothetical protein